MLYSGREMPIRELLSQQHYVRKIIRLSESGDCLNIKTTSSEYREIHQDETVSRSSYLYNGDLYISKLSTVVTDRVNSVIEQQTKGRAFRKQYCY